MARGSNQKLKLLYLSKILTEETDDTHGLTLREITAALRRYGVNADRKTLYTDFEELRTFGLDIIMENQENEWTYHMGSRDFELAELKLLVDSVQASRFITERKSRELIKKLEGLASRQEAGQLHRQVLISGRVKTMNESIYYNVDKIHAAINADSRIHFQYFQWNVKKEMVLRHNGMQYDISPWALIWDDENYYMVGYDAEADGLKHYRVDKMLRISSIGEKRLGRSKMKEFDLAAYSKGLFGMYGGETVRVSLTAANEMAGIFIDRFGKDITLIPQTDRTFSAHVRVAVSPQFLSWVIGLGDQVRITGPESVLHMIKDMVQKLSAQYLSP